MNLPDHFVLSEDYACYRPEGSVTLQQGVSMVTNAICCCAEHRIKKLLTNITKLSLDRFPTVAERYALAVEWADAGAGHVTMALIVAPERMKPNGFGVTVVQNRGFNANVFSDETAAVAWLRNPIRIYRDTSRPFENE